MTEGSESFIPITDIRAPVTRKIAERVKHKVQTTFQKILPHTKLQEDTTQQVSPKQSETELASLAKGMSIEQDSSDGINTSVEEKPKKDVRFINLDKNATEYTKDDWENFLTSHFEFSGETLENAISYMMSLTEGIKRCYEYHEKHDRNFSYSHLPSIRFIEGEDYDAIGKNFLGVKPGEQIISIHPAYLENLAQHSPSEQYAGQNSDGTIFFRGTYEQRVFFAGIEEADHINYSTQFDHQYSTRDIPSMQQENMVMENSMAFYDAQPWEFQSLLTRKAVAEEEGLTTIAHDLDVRIKAASPLREHPLVRAVTEGLHAPLSVLPHGRQLTKDMFA